MSRPPYVRKEDLDVIRTFPKPPEAVKDLLKCLVILLDDVEDYITWYEIQDLQKNTARLMKRMQTLDKSSLKEIQIDLVRQQIEKYDRDTISCICLACVGLWDWILHCLPEDEGQEDEGDEDGKHTSDSEVAQRQAEIVAGESGKGETT